MALLNSSMSSPKAKLVIGYDLTFLQYSHQLPQEQFIQTVRLSLASALSGFAMNGSDVFPLGREMVEGNALVQNGFQIFDTIWRHEFQGSGI